MMRQRFPVKQLLLTVILSLSIACAHTKSTSDTQPPLEPETSQKMIQPLPAGLSEAQAADWILEKSSIALGSDKISALKSRTRESTTTLIGQGIQLQGVSHWEGMDKVYNSESFPGLGNIISAYDGTIAWSQDPILGLRQLEGPELAQLRQAGLGVEADYASFFPTRALVETLEENDSTLYHIQLTPTEGEAIHVFIDASSFLTLRQETIAVNPQGRVSVVSTIGDYRWVDDMNIPHKVTSMMGPISMEQIVNRIVHNEEIDPAIFAMPQQ